MVHRDSFSFQRSKNQTPMFPAQWLSALKRRTRYAIAPNGSTAFSILFHRTILSPLHPCCTTVLFQSKRPIPRTSKMNEIYFPSFFTFRQKTQKNPINPILFGYFEIREETQKEENSIQGRSTSFCQTARPSLLTMESKI